MPNAPPAQHVTRVACFANLELRDAPEQEDKRGVHEVQFLAVKTSKGEFVMSNHNVHNGYYGGFSIQAEVVPE